MQSLIKSLATKHAYIFPENTELLIEPENNNTPYFNLAVCTLDDEERHYSVGLTNFTGNPFGCFQIIYDKDWNVKKVQNRFGQEFDEISELREAESFLEETIIDYYSASLKSVLVSL